MKIVEMKRMGEIPAHWELARFKRLLKERDSRSRDGGEQLLRVSQYTGVTQRATTSGAQEPDTRAESLVGYKRVDHHDLVVNIMLAWNGSMGVSDFSGIVSPAYCVYRFNPSAHPRFFHYLLRSNPYKARIKAESTGVVESRLRLYTDDLFRLEAHLPPPAEQTAIARFLDHMDRRIQKYIRAKEKLIALLDEYKQALIHQAVTGQIDVRTGKPYGEYKIFGEIWLRDVPSHWTVRRIGSFAKVGNGSTPSRSNMAYWSGGEHPWLNSSCVNQETVTAAHQFVTDIALKECHLPKVKAGSVLIGITGQGRTRGTAAILGIDATINQHIAYITPASGGISPDYLQAFLTAAYTELRAISSSSGSTIRCIDMRRRQSF